MLFFKNFITQLLWNLLEQIMMRPYIEPNNNSSAFLVTKLHDTWYETVVFLMWRIWRPILCALPAVVTMRLLESVSLQPVTQRCSARVRKEWVRFIRGHSTTMWTEFCHFLTPLLCGQFLYPERGQKQTFLTPSSPHLVHLFIEWPLINEN
jgi:hypothetical protein